MEAKGVTGPGVEPVSYTHLDVYKRQELFFEHLAYTFSFFLRDQKLLPLIRDQKSYMLLTAYTSNLHKKGDRKVCSNYRGVSVMNSIS